MECGPKLKTDKADAPLTKEQPMAQKCHRQQRNSYYSKFEMISVLSFGKAPNVAAVHYYRL